mmetsp:Transcript_5219/g.13307  ORF Transcript_5219/g.13307 Transcript_5219/m.13307 type:complete len:97 (+) Transcript_5219:19-309(+)
MKAQLSYYLRFVKRRLLIGAALSLARPPLTSPPPLPASTREGAHSVLPLGTLHHSSPQAPSSARQLEKELIHSVLPLGSRYSPVSTTPLPQAPHFD